MNSRPYTLKHVMAVLVSAFVIETLFTFAMSVLGGDDAFTIVAITGAIVIPVGLLIFGSWTLRPRVVMVCPTTGSVHCGAMTVQTLHWAFETEDPSTPLERLTLLYLGYVAAQEDTTGTLHRAVVDLEKLASWARIEVAQATETLDAMLARGLITTAMARDSDAAPAYFLTRVRQYLPR